MQRWEGNKGWKVKEENKKENKRKYWGCVKERETIAQFCWYKQTIFAYTYSYFYFIKGQSSPNAEKIKSHYKPYETSIPSDNFWLM